MKSGEPLNVQSRLKPLPQFPAGLWEGLQPRQLFLVLERPRISLGYETWMQGRTRTSRLKPLLQVFTRPVGARLRAIASSRM